MVYTVATFYHLVDFPHHKTFQTPWKTLMQAQQVTGTILLTPEGINGTIAGPASGVEAVLATLRAQPELATLTHKTSYAKTNPFPRTKVKLKRETIPLGVNLNLAQRGTYVSSQQWNDLITNPNTILIDTRNDYEVKIGAFKGAKNPKTRTFKQLPAWLDANLPPDPETPIAMYCTGGIRCEKSTAYLRSKGYRNVYHLQGGILQYLEDIPAAQSTWEGACYVFDDRVAVDHALQPAQTYQTCKRCGNPVIAADLRRHAENGCCDGCNPQKL